MDKVGKALDRLHPDILALQEVPKPKHEECAAFPSYTFHWHGSNERQGVAVAVRRPLSVQPLPMDSSLPANTIPLLVKINQIELTVLVVWTQPEPNYTGSLVRSLTGYRNLLLERSSIVLGDFNSSTVWDGNKKKWTFRELANRLESTFGLKSAWHNFHCELYGQESMPTHYHQRKPDKRFHIDYVYVPRSLKIEDARIENFESWGKCSDHRSLAVDVSIANGV